MCAAEQQEGEVKDTETQAWDDGLAFARSIVREFQVELDSLRRLKYDALYIDNWKAAAETILADVFQPEET